MNNKNYEFLTKNTRNLLKKGDIVINLADNPIRQKEHKMLMAILEIKQNIAVTKYLYDEKDMKYSYNSKISSLCIPESKKIFVEDKDETKTKMLLIKHYYNEPELDDQF